MNKLYMGIDIGSFSTKGVIIDKRDNIIASAYLYTEGDPIKATKQVIKELLNGIDKDKSQVVSVGTTGSARKLIGTLLDATTIKNDITAQTIGTIRLYPEVRTIFETGGNDAKIILVNNGMVVDYAVNTLCTAGIGAFISSLANNLNINIEEVAKLALSSKNSVNVASRCVVFAETDLLNKIQLGYKKEDILLGACQMVATNYINNLTKGKKIQVPIVFNGGVSKNMAIVKKMEKLIGENIIVNRNAHLMGAFGIAIMARESKQEKNFNYNIDNYSLETKVIHCEKCANNCQIMTVYRNNQLIDHWGEQCEQIKKCVNKGNLVV